MNPDRRIVFDIDPETIEIDPETSQLLTMGIDGETRYRFWGLASRVLFPNHTGYDYLREGILGLKLGSLEEVKRAFHRFSQREIENGNMLKLGVAAILSNKFEQGFEFLHKDWGIWEEVGERTRVNRGLTFRERLDVLRTIGRAV